MWDCLIDHIWTSFKLGELCLSGVEVGHVIATHHHATPKMFDILGAQWLLEALQSTLLFHQIVPKNHNSSPTERNPTALLHFLQNYFLYFLQISCLDRHVECYLQWEKQ